MMIIFKIIFSTGLRWLWLVAVVIGIDLFSKQWIMNNLIVHESISLIPFLNFFYAQNYGAAFSFLADKDGWQRWFFISVSITIILVLLIMMYRAKEINKVNNIAYALIVGGALGNLFDRIYHGFVVDFIDFYIGNWHFATFNIADCVIFFGAIISFIEGFITSSN